MKKFLIKNATLKVYKKSKKESKFVDAVAGPRSKVEGDLNKIV